MIALATAASIVASIVGHPFPVACHSAFESSTGTSGVTHFVAGVPRSIDLYGVCAWLGVPVDDSVYDAVAGDLLVVAHEAELARIGDMNEATAQACALDVIPSLVAPAIAGELGGDAVARYIGRTIAGRLQTIARAQSSTWPAVYQGGSCR